MWATGHSLPHLHQRGTVGISNSVFSCKSETSCLQLPHPSCLVVYASLLETFCGAGRLGGISVPDRVHDLIRQNTSPLLKGLSR